MHILFHLEEIKKNSYENNIENNNSKRQISQNIMYGYSYSGKRIPGNGIKSQHTWEFLKFVS